MAKNDNEEKLRKIEELQKKLDDLQRVYAEDVATSHHEPHQTQLMMQLLERQIHELEQSLDETRGDEFVFTDADGGEKIFYLVNDNPNSLRGRISKESVIGEKLTYLRIGDELEIGGKKLKLKEISCD